MLYKAIADLSPTTARARDNSKTNLFLGRLDSGIELDLGLHGNDSAFSFKDDFLSVQKGDVFKRVDVPKEKRLVYVEKIPREVNGSNADSSDGVFCLDMESGLEHCEGIVTKGYVPAGYLEIGDASLDEDTLSCNKCIECGCRLEEIMKLEAVVKKVNANILLKIIDKSFNVKVTYRCASHCFC